MIELVLTLEACLDHIHQNTDLLPDYYQACSVNGNSSNGCTHTVCSSIAPTTTFVATATTTTSALSSNSINVKFCPGQASNAACGQPLTNVSPRSQLSGPSAPPCTITRLLTSRAPDHISTSSTSSLSASTSAGPHSVHPKVTKGRHVRRSSASASSLGLEVLVTAGISQPVGAYALPTDKSVRAANGSSSDMSAPRLLSSRPTPLEVSTTSATSIPLSNDGRQRMVYVGPGENSQFQTRLYQKKSQRLNSNKPSELDNRSHSHSSCLSPNRQHYSDPTKGVRKPTVMRHAPMSLLPLEISSNEQQEGLTLLDMSDLGSAENLFQSSCQLGQDEFGDLICGIFWTGVCLLDSDFEHEFVAGLRLLSRLLPTVCLPTQMALATFQPKNRLQGQTTSKFHHCNHNLHHNHSHYHSQHPKCQSATVSLHLPVTPPPSFLPSTSSLSHCLPMEAGRDSTSLSGVQKFHLISNYGRLMEKTLEKMAWKQPRFPGLLSLILKVGITL
ncbi:unnamed protein product [Protopolystoma xenopodis]|uniref:Cell morphogenesis protein C-terminal domain-containing protein n=1 Tax=Protopolystoma xenopodis TaxID=117903 RepID=A0A3S5CTW1_9PLAT|nr:unnamed protein product [Protopolystoma xenopodis]